MLPLQGVKYRVIDFPQGDAIGLGYARLSAFCAKNLFLLQIYCCFVFFL